MVDKFRKDFFDKMIKEEQEKEHALKILQQNCFHKYNIFGMNHNGYQERTCSKCAHSAFKNIKVWEGTKNGQCIIA